jgi:hypothetical protein
MISYAGLPVVFAIASLTMAFACFREEPIKFLINRGTDVKFETASLRAITKVYDIGLN